MHAERERRSRRPAYDNEVRPDQRTIQQFISSSDTVVIAGKSERHHKVVDQNDDWEKQNELGRGPASQVSNACKAYEPQAESGREQECYAIKRVRQPGPAGVVQCCCKE